MDAVVIDCMGDPALGAAREATSIPVLGPAQTSMHLAALLAHSFSIVTVLDSVVPLLEDLATRLPASASADYGTPFYDIFKRYDNDFYKIDPMLFSPAEVWLTSATSGRTFHAGGLNPDVLRKSLFD